MVCRGEDRPTADRGTPSRRWAAEEKQRGGAASEEKFLERERPETWRCPGGRVGEGRTGTTAGVGAGGGAPRKVWEQAPRSAAPPVQGVPESAP